MSSFKRNSQLHGKTFSFYQGICYVSFFCIIFFTQNGNLRSGKRVSYFKKNGKNIFIILQYATYKDIDYIHIVFCILYQYYSQHACKICFQLLSSVLHCFYPFYSTSRKITTLFI